jgi:DNA-binding winged helix-turn-helix (wHTH) protein
MINDRMVQSSVLVFGPFCLLPKERRLVRDGVDVKLGSRALDLLIALTESAGEVVSKETLTARVWPDTTVHESGLRVHIAALRKALGDGQSDARYVTNGPGRGYCFVSEVVSPARSDVALSAQICRRLDGLARAIRLAAGGLETPSFSELPQ